MIRAMLGACALIFLVNCIGPKGDTGETGASGAIGPQGIQGIAGPAGQDGTEITVVQFCPGVSPKYPSTFPEVGLLIDGNIYAVYSANDGFLSLIPPGTYESNAVGSACTFIVHDDGTISH